MLQDNAIKDKIMELRTTNNTYSSKSKAKVQIEAKSAEAKVGNIVFLKHDGEKLKKRDSYLVIETNDQTQTLIICKIKDSGSQLSISPYLHRYKVKQTEVYLAPNQPEIMTAFEAELCNPEISDIIFDYEAKPSLLQADQEIQLVEDDFWDFDEQRDEPLLPTNPMASIKTKFGIPPQN